MSIDIGPLTAQDIRALVADLVEIVVDVDDDELHVEDLEIIALIRDRAAGRAASILAAAQTAARSYLDLIYALDDEAGRLEALEEERGEAERREDAHWDAAEERADAARDDACWGDVA